MSVTSIRLHQGIEESLDRLSQVLDRSKNHIINQAVKEYIESHSEELRRWEETMEALECVKNGDTVDGRAVLEWLKSWGTENEKGAPKV